MRSIGKQFGQHRVRGCFRFVPQGGGHSDRVSRFYTYNKNFSRFYTYNKK